MTYSHKFGSDWIVSPEIRFYSQTGASFFAKRFLLPRTNMSADYRLSPFGSLLGGLTLTRRLNDAMSANFGGTVTSQYSNDPILLTVPSENARATSVSAADMTVITVTFGFTWTF